ncbi:Sensory neuron membrane protein 2-like protein [Tribolium castaneum]|uniref:Sensory neuron membrane protein 2-like protein n=1 Tax=Tribolium castaneum TaxID=7070 RepID=A0A139WJ79_TRICA|nr:Sensory neuron membrane protein 2-like protein [Tribolium castaneum]
MYTLCPPTVGIFGCLALVLGVISSLYVIPTIENSYLLHAVYQNGSFLLNEFLKPEVKTVFKIYFFDVTNSEEVKKGEKPIVREIGPYVYKTIINYTETSDTFDFFEKTQLFFNAEESGGRSENDFVTVINSALITIGNNIEDQIKHQTSKVDDVFEHFLDDYDLFIKARVRDVLFDGIVINCSNESGLVCLYLKTEQTEFLRPFGNDLKFSIFNHINGTMNLKNCKNMAIILSHPHFYLGDDVLLNYVQGLSPEKKIHESFITLGARSGIILNYAVRFQFNVPIKRNKHLGTTNMREGIFPVLWTEEIQELDEKF